MPHVPPCTHSCGGSTVAFSRRCRGWTGHWARRRRRRRVSSVEEITPHTSTFPSQPRLRVLQVALLDRLLEVTPPALSRFFYANSGSEAVDNAVKIARGHTGRTNIICFDVRAPVAYLSTSLSTLASLPMTPSVNPIELRNSCSALHVHGCHASFRALRGFAKTCHEHVHGCHVQGGFHGRTYGAMALTTSKTIYRQGFAPLMPQVHRLHLFRFLLSRLLHRPSAPCACSCALFTPGIDRACAGLGVVAYSF